MKRFDLSLYLVLDPALCHPRGMVETARAAVAGGATMVQLRDKSASRSHIIETGRALMAALSGTKAKLIVNDDVEAAIAIGADGVHVGQSDQSPSTVRSAIGPDMILGLSVETVRLAACADPDCVDYLGAGPVFPTDTKPGHAPPIGLDGLRLIAAATTLPVVAIGGLKRHHVADVIGQDAKGLAVVSALCAATDPENEAREMMLAIEEARP